MYIGVALEGLAGCGGGAQAVGERLVLDRERRRAPERTEVVGNEARLGEWIITDTSPRCVLASRRPIIGAIIVPQASRMTAGRHADGAGDVGRGDVLLVLEAGATVRVAEVVRGHAG
jgi:hypothetical protein